MITKNRNGSIFLVILCVFGVSGIRCTHGSQEFLQQLNTGFLKTELLQYLREIYRSLKRRRAGLTNADGDPGETQETEILAFIDKVIYRLISVRFAFVDRAPRSPEGYELEDISQESNRLKMTYKAGPNKGAPEVLWSIGEQSIQCISNNPYDPPSFPDYSNPSDTSIKYLKGQHQHTYVIPLVHVPYSLKNNQISCASAAI